MGTKENSLQYQQLLNVSYGDETELFHARISSQHVILVRNQRTLNCYRLEEVSREWKTLWVRDNFFDGKQREFRNSFFVDESGWLLVRNREGLQFYRLEGNDLTLRHYCSDERYRDMYGWNDAGAVFLMGHIYADAGTIGVLTRNKRGAIVFEQMIESVVLKGGPRPLWKLHGSPTFPQSWKLNSTWLGLGTTNGTGQSAIIERSSGVVNVYQLDSNYQPKLLGQAENVPFSSGSDERIMFGNIFDKKEFSDMLHLNTSGMFLYKKDGLRYVAVSQSSPLAVFGREKKLWSSASLVDVDGDGRDELWLTGPQGIMGFNMVNRAFESIPFDSQQNEDLRSAQIIKTIPDGRNVTAIAVSGKTLVSFILAPSKKSSNEPNPSKDNEQSVPADSDVQSIFALDPLVPHLLEASLGEQLDTALLFEPVNPMNGNLEFAVPLFVVGKLFEMSTVKFVSYQDPSTVSGSMGVGWSLQVDCVYIDRMNSIFPENHRYYLIKDGTSFPLTSNDTNAQIEAFSTASNDQMSLTYDRTLNQWTLEDGNGESFIYGTFGNKQAIKMDKGSEDWPFPIERSGSNAWIPSVWYLMRQSDRAEQWIEYTYTKDRHTDDYLLNGITTSNKASLQLSYSTQYNSTLLTGFTIRTLSYYQSAVLHYVQKYDKVHLQRISQKNRTVLEFSYEGPNGAMSQIVYPNGLVAKFDYSSLQIDSNILMNHFTTHSHPRTAYGPTYLLIGDITKQGQVRIQLRDPSGSDTITVAGGASIPRIGKLPVVDFELHTGETFFAALLHHEQSQSELCLFHQTKADVWEATPVYLKLPKETSIRVGHDFFLAIQKHRVTVIERQQGKWKAMKPFDIEQSSLIHFFSHGFLTYDDRQLLMYVRRDGLWTAVVLPFPADMIRNSASLFDRFDHPADVMRNFKQGIKPDALQMFHNVIVFRSLFVEGFKIYSRLHLLHLNWKHEVHRQTTIDMLVEDLQTYTFNPPEVDGNTFVFAYRLENGKFRLNIIDHHGKIKDEVEKIKAQIEKDISDQPNAPEEEKNRYRKESHEKLNSELQELFRNITSQVPFAIDPSKFGVIVNDAHIVTASHKVLFDGIDWDKQRIPQEELTLDSISVNLGPSYRLVKAHRNATFDLIGPNNAAVFNTETNNATNLHIRYPAFMAVQANDSAVQLFNFHRNELTSLPVGEVLDTNSNSLAVISTTLDGKNVFVRSMDSFGITQKHVVWRHEFVDRRNQTLATYYEFDAQTATPYLDGFLMNDVKITPATTSGRYGWFKVRYNYANNTLSTKSVYDSAGNFVKLVDPAATESEQSLDPDGVLMARDGKTIVADFRPFRISEEVVTYYGYEPYEQNRIGKDEQWRWSDGKVQQDQGNHYLRLNRSAVISATMKPKIHYDSLIVSCWLRGLNEQQNNIGSALSVQFNGNVLTGSVGFTVGGWSYVEVVAESTNLLEVKISSGSNSFLDVDHLRVFPAQLDLNVHIYDTALVRERSTLHASGLLSHRLFDTLGNEMGRINEQGSIENLSILSRVNNCRIEIQPAYGEVLQNTKPNTYSGSLRYVPDTAVLRFRYAGTMHTGDVRIEVATCTFRISISYDQATLIDESQKITLPREGDMIVFCSNNHYSIWVDGHLKRESLVYKSRTNRYILTGNNVQIFDAMLLYDVNMKVIYLNDFGGPKQILELKTSDTVALQEIVYDELNRPAVKTKWTDLDTTNSSMLFGYRNNFIENEQRFWRKGQMDGLISQLNSDCQGFPYSRTVYMDYPLEDKSVQSFPGKSFAIEGPFAKHYNSNQGIDFLENLFPSKDGFYYEDEQYPDQSVYVEVYNKRKLKVASYVKTYHGDHHLTTCLYDAHDRLILQLPPAYHEQADTFSRTSPFFGHSFSAEHKQLQRVWGTWYEYDRQSELLTLKRTPDAGDTRYLYTPEGLLRFVVQQNSSSVMYYTYNSVGKIMQRGIVELGFNDLQKYLSNDSELPPSSNFLLLHHGDNDVAPIHRHRVEHIRKVSNEHVLSDVLISNHQSQIVTSVLYSSGNDSLAINYKYHKNQLHEIQYPARVRGKQFRLRYNYDNRGNLVGIANAITDEKFVSIDNNGLGLPKRMLIQPNSPHAYQRTYHYNEPGYLTKIEDRYLSETIDYSGAGYGGRAIGDGTVQATRFAATWHEHSNLKLLKLKHSDLGTGRRAKFCFDALVTAGFLDNQGRPLKSIYPLLELRLPIVCRMGTFGHQLSAALNSRGFPQLYGHRYDYGSHRQLIRAKYFQSSAEERMNPLRSESFVQIQGISQESSQDIWQKLVDAGYLHTDCYSTSVKDCHGLQGKSLFHPTITSHQNAITLSSLLVRVITQRKNLLKSNFDQLCTGWYQNDVPDTISNTCNAVWKMLSDEGFIGPKSNFSMSAINQELRDLLGEYDSHLPALVGMLYQKFATALGQSSADVQSYKIDANGNHQHFYTGFRRYRLEYVENTNKIASVYRTNFAARSSLEEVRYPVKYDEDGNVVHAPHKGVERIIYDPLFNRPTKIVLSDGRYLEFEYDVRGHRLYKYVYDSTNKLIRKKYYIRDVQGRPLVEYEGVYEGKATEASGSTLRATVFLYADNRLVGFIRNDQFYSVWLDHEGSVRLVMKNGEIVAAYDYLPYGELLRSYGDDPDGQLDYRFTGKEWDKETNLYDFHARLYDPELGRFMQMDPKEQYASPYLYAGNSPISLIDPDGQFAFLIVAVLAVGGAYVGASAANNSWNPTKWDLKKALVGGLVGGLIGGLAPAGIAGSFTFLSGYIGATAAIGVITATSVGFAYVSLSSANGSWDPSKWDWSQPGTWNALFIGSLTGATLFNAVGGIQKAFLKYTGLSRTAFVIVTTGTTGGFFLYTGSTANDGNLRFWEWDWSKPATVWGAIEGAAFGLAISPKLSAVTEQVTGRLEHLKKIGKAFEAGNMKQIGILLKEEVKAWKQIYKDVINSDAVKDGIAAGKAAGRPGGTILLDKIPPKAMEIIDDILEIEAILKPLKGIIKKKKQQRSIAYNNATIVSPSFEVLQNNNSLLKLEYCLDCPQGIMFYTSSSNKLSSWLNRMFESVFTTAHTSKQSQEDRQVTPFSNRQQKTKTPFNISNCFYTNAEDNINTITCYEQLGLSYVFLHNATNVLPITEDHYALCYPIEYNGIPSATCGGTQSSYVFTPHNRHVNYLDHLNGNLTLLLVAPTIVRNIASFVRNLLAGNKKRPEQCEYQISKVEKVHLEVKFKDLQQKVQKYRKLANNNNCCSWFNNVYKDIADDVEHFLSSATEKQPSRELYDQLYDRIEALSDELEESRQILQLKLFSNNLQSLESKGIGLQTPESLSLQFIRANSMAGSIKNYGLY